MSVTALVRTSGVTRPIPVTVAVAAVATLAAAGALVRRQPLSWDESVTAAVASRPVHAIAGTLQHSDAVLGAYYLLMHAWGELLAAVGVRATETWWRLPSAVAAVATCVVVASCARRLAGPVAALLAGGFLALLPLFSFYSVDARPYTLAALATTTAWWVWTRPRSPRPLQQATVTAFLLVIGGWLQLFTVLVWPAFVLVRGRSSLRRSLLLVGVAAVGVAPLLRVALGQSAEISWVPAATIANTVSVAFHVGGGVAVVALVAAVLVIAARAGLLRRTPMTYAVVWWTCAPFTLLAALDVVRPVLVARYALVSLPLAAVGFAVIVTRASPGRVGRLLRVAGAATVVAAVVTSTWQGSRPWKYEDYRAAAAFANGAVAPGTPVLFAPSSARLGFGRYEPAGRLHDLALPHGVGADPLAIAEEPTAVAREQVSGSCVVLVVGDALTTDPSTLTASDRAKLDMVAGWKIDSVRGFGQVTVTVAHNSGCPTRLHPGPA